MGLDKSEFDASVQGAQSHVKSSMDKIQTSLLLAGAAFTAIGVAGMKFVSDARQMNAQLGQTALTLGVTTKDMRDLALATTNVTFPLKSVSATFDLLSKAGITSTETMKNTANAFDALADATGSSAEVVASQMIPAMKTFGLTADEIARKTDMMTYMSKKSTLSLEDFNTMVGYTTPELVAQGLTIEDLTAALMLMEKDGYAPGRVMTREFMKATTKAKEEQIPLTEALGYTTEQITALKDEMSDAAGITDEYASVANEQYTIVDKVKQKFSEYSLSIGSALEPLEGMLGAMSLLGPLMLSASFAMKSLTAATWLKTAATKVATAAQWLWNAAMTANPIGILIMAIGGLVAAGIALWKNWDKVTDFFRKAWENIKMFFLKGIASVLDGLSKFTRFIPGLNKLVESAKEKIQGMIDAEQVTQDARRMTEEVEKLAGELTESIKKELEERRDAELADIEKRKSAAQKEYDDRVDELRKTYGVLLREDEKYGQTKMDLARQATEEQRKQYDKDISNAQKAHNEKIKLLDAEYAARLKMVDEQAARELADLQRQIDAIDAQTEAEEKALKEQERQQRLTELEAAVESAETEEDRIKAVEALKDYQAQVDRERLLESRRAQKDTLRAEMDAVRDAASQERDRLQEELEEKKTHEQQLLEATTARLEQEKSELDAALEAELLRIDNERIAAEAAEQSKLAATLTRLEEEKTNLEKHYAEQLEDAQLHVAAINAATAQLKDRTVTITTVRRDVDESSGGGGRSSGGGALTGYQHGGIITEPTLLTRVGELKPFGIMAEKGPEPIGWGGVNITGNNFYVRQESDIDKIADAIVGKIRLRTGLRI
jgi:hypothetical protein